MQEPGKKKKSQILPGGEAALALVGGSFCYRLPPTDGIQYPPQLIDTICGATRAVKRRTSQMIRPSQIIAT